MHISIHGETEKDILDFKVEKLIKRAKQNILFARIKIFSTYQGIKVYFWKEIMFKQQEDMVYLNVI